MKNLTFFTEKENLEAIIKNHLPNKKIININKISTGWTNIVIDVGTTNEDYIFRFPRNDFFSQVMEKDVIANNFLKQTINLKTVDMQICYDSSRPFSMHKKITGTPLTNKLSTLTTQEIDKITTEIAEFFYKIHSININSIPQECKNTLSNFLINLAQIDDNEYDYSGLLELEEDEKNNLVFVHGDLNIGNILLDNNNNICAFIDFAFTGLSDIYCDLSRISCRVNEEFLHKTLKQYELLSNIKIDMNKINSRNKMWKYVEEQYLIYAKNNLPEIEI